MPAWQNRQPRVQPRNSSTLSRSWTTSMRGTSCWRGYGQAPRSAMVRFSTRAGRAGGPWGHPGEAPVTVVGHVVAGRARRPRGPGTGPPAAPRAVPGARPSAVGPHRCAASTSLISPTTSSPSPRTKQSTKSASGSGLKAQWPPAMTTGSVGRAVGGPDGHPGQVDQVEDVGVDELGRQVEGDHVEVRRPDGGPPPRRAGTPADRMAASMSTHGAYDRSAAASGRSLRIS